MAGGRMIHHIVVPGRPRPQGDLKIGRVLAGHPVRLYHPPALKEWRRVVGLLARKEIAEPLTGPVAMDIAFVFLGNRPGPHTQTPDIDKVLRAILDALTGIAYTDDAQVCEVRAFKGWGAQDAVHITVGNWDEMSIQVVEEGVPIGV
jgi:crossover junction endodeoxyribonuclease RusA